ncbi:MAG: helix-turn-helix domain-containing protein [Schlesneria sp.]
MTFFVCPDRRLSKHFDPKQNRLVGTSGSLPIADDDEVTRKLVMLMEGECQEVGPLKAARKFGYTKQRYFQLREIYLREGSAGLSSKLRGPKGKSRRTDEVVRKIIRHRFLDPQASVDVIAQKLRQTGFTISTRSVERVIAEYGLQKLRKDGIAPEVTWRFNYKLNFCFR